jgi:hypothetical protein
VSAPQFDALLVACPCDVCRFRDRCAVELIACSAFSMFLAGESEKRWRAAPRAPTHAVWLITVGNERRPGSGRPRKVRVPVSVAHA